ncbi:MAG: hypothetical protein WD749_12950 [Phycisphaerales bacterium]
MDTHAHGQHPTPDPSAGHHAEVHEAAPGASDEPVAMVAVAVLAALVLGMCILWFYSSFA